MATRTNYGVDRRNISNLFHYNIQIPFNEKKIIMSKMVRVLLGLVAVSMLVGNILFLMETTRQLSASREDVRPIDHEDEGKRRENSQATVEETYDGLIRTRTPSK